MWKVKVILEWRRIEFERILTLALNKDWEIVKIQFPMGEAELRYYAVLRKDISEVAATATAASDCSEDGCGEASETRSC